MQARTLGFETLESRRVLATLTVTTLLDTIDFGDGQLSLREAIFVANNAAGADTIEFDAALAEGRLDLQLGELEITESLTVSNPGSQPIYLDAAEQSRIFNITAATGDFAFEHLNLARGKTSGHNLDESDSTHSGGAIRSNSSGSLTLDRVDVFNSGTVGNHAKGGGIFASGDVFCIDCWFEENFTTGGNANGGGVFSTGSLTVEGSSTFSRNWTEGDSAGGGGLYAGGGLSVADSVLLGNLTSGTNSPGGGAFVRGNAMFADSGLRFNTTAGSQSMGGGLYIQPHLGDSTSGGLYFAYGEVSDNQTTGDNSPGGAIHAAGAVTIETLSVLYNTTSGANSSGGAISAGAEVSLLSSTLSGNQAEGAGSNGGGIYIWGDLSLAHSTITENHAEAEGGGLFVGSAAAVTLDHTIVAGNFSNSVAPDLRHLGPTVSSRFSLIGSNAGSSLLEAPTTAPDASGNMIGGLLHGVIDPQLFPLSYNEGGADTHLPKPTSPVVNAGDANAIAGEAGIPLHDQRGNSFSRVRDGSIDIGALELGLLKVDTLVDEDDGDHSLGDFSLREALAQALYTKDRDVIVFDQQLFAAGAATLTLTEGELEVVDKVTIFGPESARLTISAEGNDPTPEENNGDGSRIFVLKNVKRPGELFSLGTFPSLDISNLRLTGGDVDGPGGAILVPRGTFVVNSNGASISNVLIVDNHATERGGAISVDSGYLKVSNSTISGNTSAADGGGISAHLFSALLDSGLTRGLIVENSTISQNSASSGGGLSLLAGGAAVENSVIAENSASELNTTDLYQASFSQFTNFEFSNSLVGVGTFPIFDIPLGSPLPQFNFAGTLVGVPSSPLDPLLGPLADNGGLAHTHALLPGSPAIDAGQPNLSDDFTYDQRGVGFDRQQLGQIDMGAYESQVASSADFDADGDVDGADFLAWQRGIGTANANRADGNSDDDTDVDQSDLSAWQVSFGQPAAPVIQASSMLDLESPAGEASLAGSDSSTTLNLGAAYANLRDAALESDDLFIQEEDSRIFLSEVTHLVQTPHQQSENVTGMLVSPASQSVRTSRAAFDDDFAAIADALLDLMAEEHLPAAN